MLVLMEALQTTITADDVFAECQRLGMTDLRHLLDVYPECVAWNAFDQRGLMVGFGATAPSNIAAQVADMMANDWKITLLSH
jgi:hypothetical protein